MTTTSASIIVDTTNASDTSNWVYNVVPDFAQPPPPPTYYTAYGIAIPPHIVATYGFEVCHICAKPPGDTHTASHYPLVLTEIQFPTEQKFYCPVGYCSKVKYVIGTGWVKGPRTFTRKSSLTRHLRAQHLKLLVEPIPMPAAPDATLFCDLESAVTLETLWMEAQETYNFNNDHEPEVLGSRDLVSRLSSIYMGIELALDHPRLQPLVDTEVEATMTHVLNYFVMSTLGEARYLGEMTQEDSRKLQLAHAAQSWIEKGDYFPAWLALRLHPLARRGARSRFAMWNVALGIANIVGYETLLDAVSKIFSLPLWGTNHSVGGAKWAQVAKHGLKFVRREESPLMALDSIVDVVHNGGWALNKYYRNQHDCTEHSTSLEHALNLKQKNAMELVKRCCLQPWLKGALDDELTSYLLRNLPHPTPRERWDASETMARYRLNISHTIPRDSIAHLESSEIWIEGGFSNIRNGAYFSTWLGIFGDGSIASGNTSYELWKQLTRALGCTPTYAYFSGWYNAIHSHYLATHHTRYSSWETVVASTIAAFSTPEEAIESWRLEEESKRDETERVQTKQAAETPSFSDSTIEFVYKSFDGFAKPMAAKQSKPTKLSVALLSESDDINP